MILEANRRILLVDDNPAIHEDFKKVLLDSQGHNADLDAAEAMLFDEAPKKKHEATRFSIETPTVPVE